MLLDPEERQAKIAHDAEQLAFAQGLELVEDRGLLAEVAGLVEWPVVLMGEIGEEFLDLPPEVLQTSMKEHQKFFSVRNPKTVRIERFITVANMETSDRGATILAGNQKVLAARLSDAKFFWENDLRTVRDVGLEGMARPLEDVIFHAKLGTQAERIRRIEALAREIAPKVGAKPDLVAEAARIVKADLASEMVYEFPELQGVMGGYYAKAAGHDDGVPEACEAHYRPLGPSDDVPTEPIAIAVALADKIDTLTGFWAIDEKPTGSKDPFALRRAALGIIRLLLTNGHRIALDHLADVQILRHQIAPTNDAERELLDTLCRTAVNHGLFGDPTRALLQQKGGQQIPWLSRFIEHDPAISDDLRGFIHDRLKVHLRAEDVRHDVIDACIEMPGNCDLVLLVNRVKALQTFLGTEDGANLLAGYKRASNILAKEQEKDGITFDAAADPDLAAEILSGRSSMRSISPSLPSRPPSPPRISRRRWSRWPVSARLSTRSSRMSS